MNDLVIEHQKDAQRFVLTQQGASALLEYHLHDNTINFHHTYVPVEFRGKGLAEKLVRHALAWANTQGYQISASCTYVQRFL